MQLNRASTSADKGNRADQRDNQSRQQDLIKDRKQELSRQRQMAEEEKEGRGEGPQEVEQGERQEEDPQALAQTRQE